MLSDRKVPGKGAERPTLLFVGEAPGKTEDQFQEPFVGSAGFELDSMLREIGLSRAECYITNVIKYRPQNNNIELCISSKKSSIKQGFTPINGRYLAPEPRVQGALDELRDEIKTLQPRAIVALGDTALWALTGESGITKWRGSILQETLTGQDFNVIPTYHPAAIMRTYSLRMYAVHDMRRARDRATKGPPFSIPEHAIIRPTFSECVAFINMLNTTAQLCVERTGEPLLVGADIETRAGHIACVGLAFSLEHERHGICIPYMCVERPAYFSLAEEFSIRRLVRQALTNPKVAVVWQNGMYDCQYFIREDHYMPGAQHDTMLAQHALFPGTPKDLNTLSSLYIDSHRFWKDEGKEWHWRMDEERLWRYNVRDCMALLGIIQEQQRALGALKRQHVYEYLMQLYEPIQAIMTKGVRLDWPGIRQEALWVELEMEKLLAQLELRWGSPINPRSPKQLKEIFYNHFGLPPILDTKNHRPTLNEEALRQIATREPWTRLLSDLILEYRQNGTFRSTFLEQKPSPDGRFHTAFNIGGPETFRFSASANAFGEGCNGQNLPPKFKQFVLPDDGYELEDWDLDRADAQVVAWEADDTVLKELFRQGRNIHVENCRIIFPQTARWSEEAIQASSKDSNPAKKYYTMTKSAIHATNYGVYKNTLARTLGTTAAEAQRIIDRWLGEHPQIREWHDRVEEQLQTQRCVSNAFGFSRVYFDRMGPKLVQEALAWIAQSTVAIVITKGLMNIYRNLPEVDVLLQVHDSLLLQVPIDRRLELRPKIREELLIRVPYPDPLIIPVGGKASERNWASVKDFTV